MVILFERHACYSYRAAWMLLLQSGMDATLTEWYACYSYRAACSIDWRGGLVASIRAACFFFDMMGAHTTFVERRAFYID